MMLNAQSDIRYVHNNTAGNSIQHMTMQRTTMRHDGLTQGCRVCTMKCCGKYHVSHCVVVPCLVSCTVLLCFVSGVMVDCDAHHLIHNKATQHMITQRDIQHFIMQMCNFRVWCKIFQLQNSAHLTCEVKDDNVI